MLTARIGQTLVHVTLRQTNAVVSVRFTLFSIQLVCMFVMGAAAAARTNSSMHLRLRRLPADALPGFSRLGDLRPRA